MSAPAPTEPRARVLVVDDDPIVAGSLCDFLRAEGYAPATAPDAPSALAALHAQRESPDGPFGLLISDVSLPGESGIDLLRRTLRDDPSLAVVMLTGYAHVEGAVEALRLGAVDYLSKPVVDAELRLALERALRHHQLLAENSRLRRALDTRSSLANIIGSDPRMLRIYDLVNAVAPTRTTVLMSGESGTGKSLIAHAIHQRSQRRDKPFVELSCGSIPETLLESELFGHVKGAFTGAHADKPGRFLAADHGTLFLDEINSASPAMQLKLLRVLQERRFEPVGSTRTIEVDVRIILASNQPLEHLVSKGLFRQDLFYRINVLPIELPPLRDRLSDIPMLAAHFLDRYAAELGRQIVGFAPEALDALARYAFPGNVRELENIVQRAAVLTRGQTIRLDDLPPAIAGAPHATADPQPLAKARDVDDDAWTPIPLEDALRDPERRIILRALRANNWNRQKTADDLAINRTTLYKKMRCLGIDPGDDARQAG